MSDHCKRVRRLEQRFSEMRAGVDFDNLLDAMYSGNHEIIFEQERREVEANGTKGWLGNCLASIVRGLPGADVIAPEDLERPQ